MTSGKPHYKNVPFEIPKSWEWVKLGEICNKIVDGDHNPPKGIDTPTPFMMLSSRNINHNRLEELNNVRFLSKKEFDIENERTRLIAGDILFTSVGSLGRSCVYQGGMNLCFQRSVSVIHTLINNYWLKYFFDSTYYQDYIIDKATGTAQLGFYLQQLEDSFVVVPPLMEQKRIVARLEKWFAIIDVIDNNKRYLQEFINQAKSKILSLAIEGKLLPQNENDEPAIELIRRMKPDFTPCDTSHYGNLPFEIPKNWVWVRGSDIFNPMNSTKPQGEYFDYIDIDAIDNKHNKITSPKHILSKNAPSRATREVSKGDILFSMVRPYLRNIAKVENDGFIASTGFYVCKPNNALTSEYCFYMMISNYVVNGLNSFMKGDNSPSINNDNLLSWLYPIPPIDEQKKITVEIDKIFNLLDKITAEL